MRRPSRVTLVDGEVQGGSIIRWRDTVVFEKPEPISLMYWDSVNGAVIWTGPRTVYVFHPEKGAGKDALMALPFEPVLGEHPAPPATMVASGGLVWWRSWSGEREGPIQWLGEGAVRTIPSGLGEDVMAAADLDGDGRVEILIRYDNFRRVRVHALDGTPDTRWRLPEGLRALTALDLDGDGANEVVGLQSNALEPFLTQVVVWRAEKGAGGFRELWRGPEMAGFMANEIMAVNLDGSPVRDVVMNGYFRGEHQGSFLVAGDTNEDFGPLRLRLWR